MWKDGIKTDLIEVEWGGMESTDLAPDSQVSGACECGNEPSGSIECEVFLD
jgi:hypothetical protein